MSPAAPTIQDPAARCPACDLQLRGLPITARYCPWCGQGLTATTPPTQLFPSLPPIPPLPPVEPSLRQRLNAFVREQVGEPPPPSAVQPLHSLMILGYADAMCHLGWRYETGHGGTIRNADEARRCYAKSAHLGNDYAQGKLVNCEGVNPPPRREADVGSASADGIADRVKASEVATIPSAEADPTPDVAVSSSEIPPAP
jgi:hypothetical protein